VKVKIETIEQLELWDYYSPVDFKLEMLNADGLPFFTYPDGRACYEANIYVADKLRTKSLSMLTRGGSARTCAFKIVHLLNFCWAQKIALTDLSDQWFTLFINGLLAEKKDEERVRQDNRVIDIGRQCIDFLEFIQGFHDLTDFIGEDKRNQIRIEETKIKQVHHRVESYKFIKRHSSFPSPNSFKKRMPVSESGTKQIWSSLPKQSKEKAKRDSLIFQLLEQTGGRRSEVANITINDVEEAYASANGETTTLRVITRKQKNKNSYRKIPVPLILIEELKRYIRKDRKRILKKKSITTEQDHKYILISLTTGQPLKVDSISSIVSDWAQLAGLDERIHPHLFRHAFITNKLKEMLLEHNEDYSKDEFRKFLINTERYKTLLQQLAGHSNLYSLDTYINLVFDDLAGVNKTYKAVALNSAIEVFQQELERLEHQIDEKDITPSEFLARSKELVSALRYDISIAKS